MYWDSQSRCRDKVRRCSCFIIESLSKWSFCQRGRRPEVGPAVVDDEWWRQQLLFQIKNGKVDCRFWFQTGAADAIIRHLWRLDLLPARVRVDKNVTCLSSLMAVFHSCVSPPVATNYDSKIIFIGSFAAGESCAPFQSLKISNSYFIFR